MVDSAARDILLIFPLELLLAGGSLRPPLTAADVPALFRKGAMEALGGKMDSLRNVLALGRFGGGAPLKVGAIERSGCNSSRWLDAIYCAVRYSSTSMERPNLLNDGLRVPPTEDGLY